MDGRLFYADLETGVIKEFLLPSSAAGVLPNGLTVHGFGEDANGELYALVTNTPANGTGGIVYQITAVPEPSTLVLLSIFSLCCLMTHNRTMSRFLQVKSFLPMKIIILSLTILGVLLTLGREVFAATIWSGPIITFSKANFANPTLPQNQDRITSNVWITRGNTQGIFNIAQETGYTHFSSPLHTQWANGSAANWQNLIFQDWEDWARANVNPPGTVNVDAVLHLITDNIYLDIKFLSWTESIGGGGFSYQRSTPTPTYVWKGGDGAAPTDWGAAANWDPTGVPNGPGAMVSFGSQLPANNVVDMISVGRIVGSITFAATTGTTIQSTGGYNLTLDNNGSASTIDVVGSHTINVPVSLMNDASISGSGTLHLSGGLSGPHALNVLSGDLTANSIFVDSLTVASGTTVTIQPIPGGPLANTITAVPEPSTLVLFCVGAISLLTFAWRRRE